MTPRFDEPNFTVDADEIFPGGSPVEGPPITESTDHPAMPIEEASSEPLVRITHRRIRLLANYWHAGWTHAVADSWLREGTAARLYAVADALPRDLGLAVFDAWRPLPLQVELFEASVADPAVVEGFMAPPSQDPALPPPHVSGGAVDLTLTYQGTPLALGTGFDDTTERAFVNSLEAVVSPARSLRRFLVAAMADAGFVVYPGEWWHYEFGTARWAAHRGGQGRYTAISPA